jgi:hypothetical protein
VQAAGAVPLMNAAGTSPVNTAANYRQAFIGALVAPAPGGPMIWRSGVIPTSLTSGATINVDLSVNQTTTASSSVTVTPGNCVISRSGASGGPYAISFPTVSTLVSDPAASTNPRIDVVAIQLTDAAIGDSGTQGGQLIIVNGVAGAIPAVPAVPTGAIAIAQLYRATNTNPVATANITDVRRSTCSYGGMRALLPGDLAADAGSYIGEWSFDAVTSLKRGPCYWDGTAWRGMLTTLISSTLVIATSAALTYNSGTPYVVCSATVADPGFPYLLNLSGKCGGSNMTAPSQALTYLTLDSTAATSPLSIAWSTFAANTVWESNNSTTHTGKLTGAHTAYLLVGMNASGNTANMSASANDMLLNVQLIPW